jgi:hypothetical protein
MPTVFGALVLPLRPAWPELANQGLLRNLLPTQGYTGEAG